MFVIFSNVIGDFVEFFAKMKAPRDECKSFILSKREEKEAMFCFAGWPLLHTSIQILERPVGARRVARTNSSFVMALLSSCSGDFSWDFILIGE